MNEYTLEVGGWLITVEVLQWTAYLPARISGPPEYCCEAEGGEIEFKVLAVEPGSSHCLDDLPSDEEFGTLLWEHIEKQRYH